MGVPRGGVAGVLFRGCRDILVSWPELGSGGVKRVVRCSWRGPSAPGGCLSATGGCLSRFYLFFVAAWQSRFSGQPWRVHEGLAISSRIGYMLKYLSDCDRYLTGNHSETKSMWDAGSFEEVIFTYTANTFLVLV